MRDNYSKFPDDPRGPALDRVTAARAALRAAETELLGALADCATAFPYKDGATMGRLSIREIAAAAGESRSWVSRRLGNKG